MTQRKLSQPDAGTLSRNLSGALIKKNVPVLIQSMVTVCDQLAIAPARFGDKLAA